MIKATVRRETHLDLLRVFASFTVIILHVSAQNWTSVPVTGFSWQVFNFYNSSVRCAVPVFIMLSGALFLQPERNVTIRSMWTKRIPRLFVAYIAWSGIYALYTHKGLIISGAPFTQVLKAVAATAFKSHYHLWFLPIMLGSYIAIPILRCITEHKNSKKLCTYFLTLFIIFGIFRPTLFALNIPYMNYLSDFIGRFGLTFFSGWFGYMLLGYFLNTWELKLRYRIVIYALGAVGWLVNCITCSLSSISAGEPVTLFFFEFSAPTMFMSAAWFVFFRYGLGRGPLPGWICRLASAVSGLSFGVYLVHALFIDILARAGMDTLSFNALLSVPVISLAVLLISIAAAKLMSKIPVVNRYLM